MQAVGGLQVQTGLPLTPPGSSIVACGQSNDEQHETKLQKWWDHAIAKHMDLPDGYRDVHVLMVKWEDSIDQLNVRPEVGGLITILQSPAHRDVLGRCPCEHLQRRIPIRCEGSSTGTQEIAAST